MNFFQENKEETQQLNEEEQAINEEEAAAVTYKEVSEIKKEEKKVYADISANKSLEPPVVNPFRMLLTLDFYLFFIIYLIGSGCGLVIINNLGAIVVAYGGYNGQQDVMVQLLSVL